MLRIIKIKFNPIYVRLPHGNESIDLDTIMVPVCLCQYNLKPHLAVLIVKIYVLKEVV